MNRAAPQKALTDFGYTGATNPKCEAGYSEPGSYWILEPVLTISYYYDQAYKSRNSSAQSFLTQRQAEIATILKYVFGISPVLEEPGSAPIQSFSDECSNDKDEYCECRTATDHKKECAQNYNTTNYHLVHHKSCTGILLKFNDNTKTTGAHKVCVLISGHVNCGKDGSNHEYNAVAGVARRDLRVATSFVNNASTAEVREKLTSLHEISHCLGAAMGIDSPVDKLHNQVQIDIDNDGDLEKLGKCVMSSSRYNQYLLQQWDLGTGTGYKNLFCTECFQMISDYLYNEF